MGMGGNWSIMPKIHISEETKERLIKLMEKEVKKKIDNGLLDDLRKKSISFDFVISKILNKSN